MRVILFDWGFCMRVNRDKLSSRQTGIDLKNEIKFYFCLKDETLAGKTQVNIYLLSLLILYSMYVTRSRQSEGRSLNTSKLIISLAK